MGLADNAAVIPVGIGACLCPATPHPEGDVVYLRQKLDMRAGFRIKRRLLDLNRAASAETDVAELEIALAEVYLEEGVTGWNLVDSEGEIELTPENLREHLFSDYSRAEVVADKADDLYRPAVLDPLFQRVLSSLPATPTKGSTRPTNGHGSKRSTRAKRSSTSTSPTASIEEIT